jgi:hypothetical protein
VNGYDDAIKIDMFDCILLTLHIFLKVIRVLRDNKDSLMAMLEAFVYDPLISWRLLGKDIDRTNGQLSNDDGGWNQERDSRHSPSIVERVTNDLSILPKSKVMSDVFPKSRAASEISILPKTKAPNGSGKTKGETKDTLTVIVSDNMMLDENDVDETGNVNSR